MTLNIRAREESKMFCSHCGNNLENEQVCNHCGFPADEIVMPAIQSEPNTNTNTNTNNGLAMASLICGIASWSTCGGGFVLPFIGLWLGIWGLKSEQPEVAVVGIILNTMIVIVIVLPFLLVAMIGLMEASSSASSGRCC